MSRAAADRARVERLALDIDCRLADLWRDVDGVEEWTLDVVAAFLRAAYGAGYTAALTEPHGKLYRENGYRVPGRSGS